MSVIQIIMNSQHEGDKFMFNNSRHLNIFEHYTQKRSLPDGTPIAHRVLPGNTNDIKAFLQTIEDCRHRFNIRRVIIVADRGMVSQATIEALEQAVHNTSSEPKCTG